MLPPKHGHILGCLAFSDFFLPKIKSYPGRITFLKIQWEIHFLIFFLNIDQDSLKFFLKYKYGVFHVKSASGINFLLHEVVKRKIRKYAHLRIFRLTTSRSQKLIPKADLK